MQKGGAEVEKCFACPRLCGADRSANFGFCGEGVLPRVARAAPHYWEEPCISGINGSGAVFFAGCNLRCVYCQNSTISRGEYGKTLSASELADIFLRLQAQGVHNINLVTPSHFVLPLKTALETARVRGLCIPVVWNSGGYEAPEQIRLLDGLVDIYMPDFKYKSPALAARYSAAADYPTVAEAVLDEMVLQCGGAVFDGALMRRGVVVRHLVLPGCVEDSKNVLHFLHRKYGAAIYISIMRQYTPLVPNLPDELNRTVTDDEYNAVLRFAERIGIKNGFIQEGAAADSSFIPPFDMTGVDM